MSLKKPVVMKFGGTSVQDSDSIQNVIRIVRETPSPKVVVVSAISKATTSLENIAYRCNSILLLIPARSFYK